MVERALGFAGDETLYVGDHIYTDVSQSKLHLRWRTCLICRELEQEVREGGEGRGGEERGGDGRGRDGSGRGEQDRGGN